MTPNVQIILDRLPRNVRFRIFKIFDSSIPRLFLESPDYKIFDSGLSKQSPDHAAFTQSLIDAGPEQVLARVMRELSVDDLSDHLDADERQALCDQKGTEQLYVLDRGIDGGGHWLFMLPASGRGWACEGQRRHD